MGIETTTVVEESTEPPICGLTNATRINPPGISTQETTSTTPTILSAESPSNEKPALTPTTDTGGPYQNPVEPHTLSVSQLESVFKTNAQHGLSGDEAARRLEQDGPNKVEGAKGLSLWKILVRQVSNALTMVLLIVMALSFAIQDFIEGGVIAAVILLNIVVGLCSHCRHRRAKSSAQGRLRRSKPSISSEVTSSCSMSATSSRLMSVSSTG